MKCHVTMTLAYSEPLAYGQKNVQVQCTLTQCDMYCPLLTGPCIDFRGSINPPLLGKLCLYARSLHSFPKNQTKLECMEKRMN